MRKHWLRHIIFFSVFLSIWTVFSSGGDKHKKPEEPKSMAPLPYEYRKEGKDKEIKIQSLYLTMRDGVQIATNVYLPVDLKEGEKLPVIFHQTRYWRSIDLRWPVNVIKGRFVDLYAIMIKKMVLNRYIVVNVDVRGTGASSGCQPDPFSQDQMKDGAEIIDWIIKQKWASGDVGLVGASYTGMSAEFSLANKHPNVKALMSLYTGFDFYDEMIFPGGVFHQKFIKDFGDVCDMLDRNDFTVGSRLENFFIKGVTPVQHRKTQFKKSLEEHRSNFNIYEQTYALNYRNDHAVDNTLQSIEGLSLHAYLKQINESKVPIFLYTGWFDGCFALGSARLFNNLQGNKHKLLIGPWDHGSLYNCTPYIQKPSTFDRMAEVLKFFDYHLKHKETGIYDEAPVHYYTMVEEEWKASSVWPPQGTVNRPFYFGSNNQLTTTQPQERNAHDIYVADTTVGTGRNTRSESLVFQLTSSDMYDSRTERDKKLLCYTTPQLQEDVEVTGHPIVSLYISADTTDASLFVYLEDVDETGKVHYITEGVFRAIHRNSKGDNGYKDIVPSYTYLKNTATPLQPNEIAKVEFDLLPVSYLFKKGHSIRIAVSCSDEDHYKTITTHGSKIKVYRGGEYTSGVVLPVMPDNKAVQKP